MQSQRYSTVTRPILTYYLWTYGFFDEEKYVFILSLDLFTQFFIYLSSNRQKPAK